MIMNVATPLNSELASSKLQLQDSAESSGVGNLKINPLLFVAEGLASATRGVRGAAPPGSPAQRQNFLAIS